jgi:diguanylate cyclase (GGDEF)-like protein/PAS domain S-box-containing protein
MLGYQEHEITNTLSEWTQRVHPDNRANLMADIQNCLEGKSNDFSSEYRIRCEDGNWKWVLGRGAVVSRDAEGRTVRMIGTNVDISEKKKSDEEIWRRANFDVLTGLPNRSMFRDRLEHEVITSRRSNKALALLFIDLDHFKEVNDLLGHDAGDMLLRQAADRISSCVRGSDTVARLGGDEFTVILTALDNIAHVDSIAQKILYALARPFRFNQEVIRVSGSIGITICPEDASEPEHLVRNADQAMYVAKNAGRNQFSYFTRSMQDEARRRLRLIDDLRHAVPERQLKVYFQPIVDLASGQIVKAEALVRWIHPDKGLLSPTEFIELAEECGVINEIGNWIFIQAVAWSKRWSDELGFRFQISINKSPVEFMSQSTEINWAAHLQDLGLAWNSISVEITEGLLLNTSPEVEDKLLALRGAGIQVAIDDFGTGYSSMAYLKKFDVDYLKIDQSFVRDTDNMTSSRTIAETIIVMAHKLGLKVIAEGIETPEQRDWLKAAGCDFGQGFLFSEPIPPERFEKLLKTSYIMPV